MADIELTEKQIQDLGLSSEQISDLATASPIARKASRNKIVNKFRDKLEENARLIDDSNARTKAIEAIPDLLAAARKHIKEQIKTGGKDARNIQAAYDTFLRPLTEMNIYHDGELVNENFLYNEVIDGKIDIRNPKPSVLNNPEVKTALSASQTPDAFKANFQKIKQRLEDMSGTKEYKKLTNKFPTNKYLGAIDVSKATNRVEVYNFWDEVGGRYDNFINDMAEFFVAAKAISWENPKVAAKFNKLYNDVNNINLEYIVEFEEVEERFLSARHRFFNIIAHRLHLEGLMRPEEGNEGYHDDHDKHGDVNSQLAEQLQSTLGNSSTQGDTLDLNQWAEHLTTELTWDDEYDALMGAADPLLLYESNRGEKLIAINDEMEGQLLEVLEELIEELDDGNGVSLDTTTDIEEWMEQLEDTQILAQGSLKGKMALPISVMNNKDFARLYTSSTFKSVDEGKTIGVDNIGLIKNFFADLYQLLSGDDFRMEVEARTTKGRRRGSVTEPRERRQATGDTGFMEGSTKIPISLNRGGGLRGDFKSFQSELQKMMDSALDYYFDPIYSGLLPIDIPNFASSIGSKVLQTLSLQLGLETVMSSAYDTLFEGSAEEVDVGNLREIADFLDNIFMPEVKIDDELITEGEFAAEALTEIFGREEENNDYCAALIHHYMVDTGDTSREGNDFDGKTIKERAESFDKKFTSRKAFPVFAMPHWLDMNQGVLTKKSPSSKTQYNRLKTIFESAQTDLPVLLHKLLKAHDAIRNQLNKKVVYGYVPLNDYGINKMITKMQVDENIDLSYLEVEQIVKAVDSHENISREYGISGEQVYLIKANFR